MIRPTALLALTPSPTAPKGTQPRSRRLTTPIVHLPLLILATSPAAAHGSLPGGGGFAAGFAHPFLAPDHLLLLTALAALLGRHHLRRPLPALLAGLLAGYAFPFSPLQPYILILTLLIGIALATALPLSPRVTIPTALLSGVLIGADTDPDAALIAYAGLTTAVFLITLNIMALAQFAAPKIHGIPLRIAGSWVAAAAILLLAFLARPILGLT